MRVLLDTNVISELVSRQLSKAVLNWMDSLDQTRVYLSVITLGEIHRGVERLPESAKKVRLRSWPVEDLLLRFEGRIMPIDVGVMMAWGTMVSQLTREGRTLSAMDSLIAATAIHHELPLATRNESDFSDTGVRVINPWR